MAYYLTNETELESIADAIREKSGISTNLTYPTDFVNKIRGLSSSKEKDVNFIDYDGTLLYAYSATDFMNLTSMPTNPSHTGLTAQGWNYTLAQAKAEVTAQGKCTIGQMYITDDGKTRIYCHFNKGRLAPYLGLGINGTVVVDWGDNSNTDTLTGTSLGITISKQHIYATEGDYVISLTVIDGEFSFLGYSTATLLLRDKAETPTNFSKVYANAISRIEIGANVSSFDTYAFSYCRNLTSITIPNNLTLANTNIFYYCEKLTSIIIPNNSATSIGDSTFYTCESLTFVAIPNSIIRIGSQAFYYCNNLRSIVIPSSVTNIGGSAFSNCRNLTSIIISNNITDLDTYAFNECRNLTSIIIPNNITKIAQYMFYNCVSLRSIIISNNTTYIETRAFNTCYSLASITIPESVISIAALAFSSCYGLGEIHFQSATPPTVANSNAWQSLPTDCIIYVPTGSLSAYTSATNYPSSSTYTYMEE